MTTNAGEEKSRLDPEPMPRRDFLGLGALAAAAASMFFATIGMLRLPKAAVLSSPSKKYNVSLPDTLAKGEAYVPPGRSVAIFKDDEGVYAISIVCTHLGCIVKPTTEGFECPCHGSRFTSDGSVAKGPAPKPLPWQKITNKGNAFVVDEGEIVKNGTKV